MFRFSEFENDDTFVRFICQNEEEPRDGLGCRTVLKFKCKNGKSPIDLLFFSETKVTFRIQHECKLCEGDFKNETLNVDEIYHGYPDGKIKKI